MSGAGGEQEFPSPMFEGAEKKLVLYAADAGAAAGGDLRRVARAEWDAGLALAGCSVISVLPSAGGRDAGFDAYLLSESSLFVYARQVVVKTCGRTEPLKMVPTVARAAAAAGLAVSSVTYSRSNFQQPELQPAPHSDGFAAEAQVLDALFPGAAGAPPSKSRICGQAHSFAPCCEQPLRWHAYVNECAGAPAAARDSTLEVAMLELDACAAARYHRRPALAPSEDGALATAAGGIGAVLRGYATDSFMFEPCGYSLNGAKDGRYATVHITPEHCCSFASFETNDPELHTAATVALVVAALQPRRFSVALTQQGASPRAPAGDYLAALWRKGMRYTASAKTYRLGGSATVEHVTFSAEARSPPATPPSPGGL